MGANPHSRLVALFSAQTLNGFATYPDGDSVPRGVETKRIPRSPEAAWDDVSSAEAYENGHSYSGDFGSKHGMHLAGKAPVSKAVVAAAGRLVERIDNGEGLVPQDDDERTALAAYGTYAFQTAADLYGDKWGPAAGFAGTDYVWFGGWCSS